MEGFSGVERYRYQRDECVKEKQDKFWEVMLRYSESTLYRAKNPRWAKDPRVLCLPRASKLTFGIYQSHIFGSVIASLVLIIPSLPNQSFKDIKSIVRCRVFFWTQVQ